MLGGDVLVYCVAASLACCRYVAASLSAVWRHPCFAVWRPPCFLWWSPPCLLGGGCVVLLVGGMGLVVSPVPTRCALSPARSPLSSVGCVTSPGRHNRSFSVLGAPRHQGATIKGGLFGLCPQPEGPPKPFLRCSPFFVPSLGCATSPGRHNPPPCFTSEPKGVMDQSLHASLCYVT